MLQISRIILLTLGTLLIWIGCQVKITDYNPAEGIARYSVDAVVADSVNYHYVKIARVLNVTDNSKIPVVSDAQVLVEGTDGIRDTFRYVNNGMYRPSKPWKGTPGATYTIRISTPDLNIIGSEEIPNYPSFTIDSMVPFFRETARANRVANNSGPGSYNDLFFTGKKYIQTGDSVFRVRLYALKELPYRVNVFSYLFRNGVKWSSNTRFFVNNLKEVPINDFFIMPPPGDGPPQNVHFLSGDTVTVVLEGLTDRAFAYYAGLNQVLQFDGGLFSSPAGNPINNYNNPNVYGYFKAVRVANKQIVVRFNGKVDD